MGQQDDFYVKFGSNAKTFAAELERDLANVPPVIAQLRSQLAALAADTGKLPGSSSIDRNLTRTFATLNNELSEVAGAMHDITVQMADVAKAFGILHQNIPKPRTPAQNQSAADNLKQGKLTAAEARAAKGAPPATAPTPVKITDVPRGLVIEADFSRTIVSAINKNVRATKDVEAAVNRLGGGGRGGRGGRGDGGGDDGGGVSATKAENQAKAAADKAARLTALNQVQGKLASGETISRSLLKKAAAGSDSFIKDVTSGDMERASTRVNNAIASVTKQLEKAGKASGTPIGGAGILSTAEGTTQVGTTQGKLRTAIRLRERELAVQQLRDQIVSTGEIDPKLLKRAAQGSDKFIKDITSGDMEKVAGRINKALASIASSIESRAIPSLEELKRALAEDIAANGVTPHVPGSYGGKRKNRKAQEAGESVVAQVEAEVTQGVTDRAKRKAANRAAAQAARELDVDTTLTQQERAERLFKLQMPLASDFAVKAGVDPKDTTGTYTKRGGNQGSRAKGGIRRDELLELVQLFQEEGYDLGKITGRTTKPVIAQRLMAAAREFDANGGVSSVYDLRTSERRGTRVPDVIGPEAAKFIGDFAKIERAVSEAAALDVLRKDARGGGQVVEKMDRGKTGGFTPSSPIDETEFPRAGKIAKGRRDLGSFAARDVELSEALAARLDEVRAKLRALGGSSDANKLRVSPEERDQITALQRERDDLQERIRRTGAPSLLPKGVDPRSVAPRSGITDQQRRIVTEAQLANEAYFEKLTAARVAAAQKKISKNPSYDPYDPAIDAAIQGRGPKARQARRDVSQIRRAFEAIDQFTDSLRDAGLERFATSLGVDSIALLKGREVRRKAKEDRDAVNAAKGETAMGQRDLRPALLELLAGTRTGLGSGRTNNITSKLLPGVSITPQNALAPAPNSGKAAAEFQEINHWANQAIKLERAIASTKKEIDKLDPSEVDKKAAELEKLAALERHSAIALTKIFDEYDKIFNAKPLAAATKRLNAADLAVAQAKKGSAEYKKALAEQKAAAAAVQAARLPTVDRQLDDGTIVREYGPGIQAEAVAERRRASQRERTRIRTEQARLRAKGVNLLDPASLDVESQVDTSGRAKVKTAVDTLDKVLAQASKQLARFDTSVAGSVRAMSHTGEVLASVQTSRSGKFLDITAQPGQDPGHLEQLRRVAIGEAVKQGLTARIQGAAREGMDTTAVPYASRFGEHYRTTPAGIIPTQSDEILSERAKTAARERPLTSGLAQLEAMLGRSPLKDTASIPAELNDRQARAEIEQARRVLAASGVQWNKEINKSLNDAKTLQELIDALKRAIADETLVISQYNSRLAERVQPGSKKLQGRNAENLTTLQAHEGTLDEEGVPITLRGRRRRVGTVNALPEDELPKQLPAETIKVIGTLGELRAKGEAFKGTLETTTKATAAATTTAKAQAKQAVTEGKAGKGGFSECCDRIVAGLNKIDATLRSGVVMKGARVGKAGAEEPSGEVGTKTTGKRQAAFTAQARATFFDQTEETRRAAQVVRGKSTPEEQLAAAAAVTQRGYQSMSVVAKIFSDELKHNAADAKKFADALRELARTQELEASSTKKAKAIADADAESKRYEARAAKTLADTKSKLSTTAAAELSTLTQLRQAGVTDVRITDQQAKVYALLNKELKELNLNGNARRRVMQQTMGVSEPELNAIARSASINSAGAAGGGEVTNAGRRAGAQYGDQMGLAAQSAFEARLFGSHGFWSRIINSTGTFIIRNFSAGFVFGITNMLQDAIQQGIETQSTFVRVSQALEQTGRSTDNVRAGLSSLSQEYGVALKDVYTSAAGLTGLFDFTDVGNEGLLRLTRISTQLQLISGGALNATEAMKSLASVTSAYTEMPVQQVADILTSLQNQLGVNIEVSIEGVARLSAQTKELGLNFAEAATYVDIIAKFTGQEGSAAGEQFSRMLASLATSRTQKVIQSTYGEAAPGIINALRSKDFGTAIAGMLSGYEKLDQAQQNQITAAIGAQRQQAATQALFGQGSRALTVATKAENDFGAAETRAAGITAQLAAQIEKVRQGFVNFISALVEAGVLNAFGAALKVIQFALNGVNGALNTFNAIADKIAIVGLVRDWGMALLGFAAITKVAMVAFSHFTQTLGAVKNAGAGALARFGGGTSVAPVVEGAEIAAADRLAATRAAEAAQARAAGNAFRRTQTLESQAVLAPSAFSRGAAKIGLGLAENQAMLTAYAARLRTEAAVALSAGNATKAEILLARAQQAQALAAGLASRGLGGAAGGMSLLSKVGGTATIATLGVTAVIALLAQGFNQLKQDAEGAANEFKPFDAILKKDAERGKAPNTMATAEEELDAKIKKFNDSTTGWENVPRAFSLAFDKGVGIIEEVIKSIGDGSGDIAGAFDNAGKLWDQAGNVRSQETTDRLTAAMQSAQESFYNVPDRNSKYPLAPQVKPKTADELAEATRKAYLNVATRVKEIKDSNAPEAEKQAAELEAQKMNLWIQRTATTLGVQIAGLGATERFAEDAITKLVAMIPTMGSESTDTSRKFAEYNRYLQSKVSLDQPQNADLLKAVNATTAGNLDQVFNAQVKMDVADKAAQQAMNKLRSLEGKEADNPDLQKAEADMESAKQAYETTVKEYWAALLTRAQNLAEIAKFTGNMPEYARQVQAQIDAIRGQIAQHQIDPIAGQIQIENLENALVQSRVERAKKILQATASRGPAGRASAVKQAQGVFEASVMDALHNGGNEDVLLGIIAEANDLERQAILAKLERALAVAKAAADEIPDPSNPRLGAWKRNNNVDVATTDLQRLRDAVRATPTKSTQDPYGLAAADTSAADKARALDTARRNLAIARIDPTREVAIARARLSAAVAEQHSAAAQFGRNSAEYYDATAAVIEAQRAVSAALQTVVEANSNLAIAFAEAAGKTVEAARLRLAAAQQKLAVARRAGGTGTAAYKNAKAEEVSAAAAYRDAKLQDALDTINFNKEMGYATATETIKALNELLKLKTLTQEQRRSIMLQIKGLQDELNSQFSGQWNIGDSIKMPTPYEMRKVLGIEQFQKQMADMKNDVGSPTGGAPSARQASASAITAINNLATAIAAKGDYITNDNSTITVNGTDIGMVKRLINDALGSSTTGRSGTATRR